MKFWHILMASAAAAVTLPAFAQMAAPPVPPAPAVQNRTDVETKVRERLGRFDADKNGTVTRDEMKTVIESRMKARNEERFTAMDTDKNGSISRTEFDAHHTSGMMAMKRGSMQAKRGERGARIERRMLMSGGRENIVIADAVRKALDRFDAADTNRDGMISAEERKAQRGAWRARRG